MAGYPKIWTTIRHENWFKSLSNSQRGIWLQVILIAKEQTDDGWISFNNVTHFAQELRADRCSCEAWLGSAVLSGRVGNMEKSKQLLRFFITNYNSSQQVKRYSPDKKPPVSRAYKHITTKQAEKKEGSREPADFKKPTIQKRTPAQKWTDGQFNLISKKYQEIWSSEPDIKDMVAWLQWADKSAGLVIVGLQRAKAYEEKAKESIDNITAWLRSDFKKRGYWTDGELAEIKKIDRDYETQYKSRTNIKTVGKIFQEMV